MTDLQSGIVAEFETSAPMVAVADRLYRDGFRAIVTFTPYAVPGIPSTLRLGRTKLPLITLIGGLSGAVFAYWLQWYTAAVSYPLNVGARPPHAVLAFILITFETTVLFASCAGFFGVFVLLGLPKLWHPISEIKGFERATVDRFWVGVSRDDPEFDAERITLAMAAAQPLRIVRLEME